MVFSKLLDSLKGLISSNDEAPVTNNQSNIELINELSQGMVLLNNRKEQLDKLRGRMKLIENITGFAQGKQTLKNTSQKELQILQKLEQDYNKQLSSYSTNYKTFMMEYQKGVSDVKKCKANCLTSIPRGSSAWSYKRQACQAGCDLNGPYVQPCEDTFKTSRVGSKNCKQSTAGRCQNGQVELGMDNIVTSSNYADANGITIKNGC